MKDNWDYLPYNEEELKTYCSKSSSRDFYFSVGEAEDKKSFVIITPKKDYDKYNIIYSYHILPIQHLLPEGLTISTKSRYDYDKYTLFTSDKDIHSLRKDFINRGFIEHPNLYKLIEVWFFKKPLQNDMEMEIDEFQKLMKLTTLNLQRLRAAQQYNRWQFGSSIDFEEFASEIKDTVDGWVSSHC